MTQRHIGTLFIALWLLCGVLLLQGATVRIPPSRPGAIRVQAAGTASTGTTPTPIPTSQMDFMFASLGDYDDTTGQWTDTGPKGWHATQSTPSLRPTKNADGLSFEANKKLVVSSYSKSTSDTVITIVFVAKLSASSADTKYIYDGSNSGGGRLYAFTTATQKLNVARTSVAQNSDSSSACPTDTAHTYIVTYTSGQKPQFWIDGVEQTMADVAQGNTAQAGFVIGQAFVNGYGPGDDFRLLRLYGYGRALTGDERTKVAW